MYDFYNQTMHERSSNLTSFRKDPRHSQSRVHAAGRKPKANIGYQYFLLYHTLYVLRYRVDYHVSTHQPPNNNVWSLRWYVFESKSKLSCTSTTTCMRMCVCTCVCVCAYVCARMCVRARMCAYPLRGLCAHLLSHLCAASACLKRGQFAKPRQDVVP